MKEFNVLKLKYKQKEEFVGKEVKELKGFMKERDQEIEGTIFPYMRSVMGDLMEAALIIGQTHYDDLEIVAELYDFCLVPWV